MPEIAFTQAQGMQVSQMLNTGRVAMTVEAVPNLDFITALKIDWDMAPLPLMGDKPPLYFRSASGGLSLSSSCAHPQDAWELMKWLVTQSPYNTPNPVLREVDFVGGWEARYPKLRETHFRQVWELSERFDGGDTRDFVRYSSWSSNAILEQLSPKMDLLFAGKMSVPQLVQQTDEINRNVLSELRKILRNENLQPAFRDKIKEELRRQNVVVDNME
jgi:hypothetical protein